VRRGPRRGRAGTEARNLPQELLDALSPALVRAAFARHFEDPARHTLVSLRPTWATLLVSALRLRLKQSPALLAALARLRSLAPPPSLVRPSGARPCVRGAASRAAAARSGLSKQPPPAHFLTRPPARPLTRSRVRGRRRWGH